MVLVALILLFVALTGFSGIKTSSTDLRTDAFDRKTGNRLYTEVRNQADYPDRPGVWYFTYSDELGKTIVQRSVNFEKDMIKPDFRLNDLRNGYSEGAEVIASGIRVFSGGSPDEPLEQKLLLVPEPAVIDAGFNFFVEKNWDRLMNGEVLSFNFVAPSQLDYFSLRVYKKHETTWRGKPAVVMNMDVDNFLIRLFVEAIHMTYDKSSRKLVVYDGISNIYDAEGKSHKVRMEFNYKDP
jgi:hypothetical protein